MGKWLLLFAAAGNILATSGAAAFEPGVGPYFGDVEDEDWLADYREKAAAAGDLIFCPENIYWEYLKEGFTEPDVHQRAIWFADQIEQTGCDVYLGINLLSDDRQGLYTAIPAGVPYSPGYPFAEEDIRTAYADECKEIVDHAWDSSGGRVKYVALVMEMDFYYYDLDSRNDYGNLVDAVTEAYDAIKAEEEYEDMEVGVYFTLNMLWYHYVTLEEEGIYDFIVGDGDLNATLDFLGGSAYPMGPGDLFENPGEITQNPEYFIYGMNATALPFQIPETGWSSEDVTFPGNVVIESDEREQQGYVTVLQNFAFAASVPVIWNVLHDITEEPEFIPFHNPYGIFQDMGLWNEDFSDEKEVWDTWCGP